MAACREQPLPQGWGRWLSHSAQSLGSSWDCAGSQLCVCVLSRAARKRGEADEGWKGERKDGK